MNFPSWRTDTAQAQSKLLVVSLCSSEVSILRMSNGHTCARRWLLTLTFSQSHEFAALRQTRKYRTLPRGWIAACSLQHVLKLQGQSSRTQSKDNFTMSLFHHSCNAHPTSAQSMLRSLPFAHVADASCTCESAKLAAATVTVRSHAHSPHDVRTAHTENVMFMRVVPYTPRQIVSFTRQARWQVSIDLRKLLCDGHAVRNRARA